jgi:hypothetical protein
MQKRTIKTLEEDFRELGLKTPEKKAEKAAAKVEEKKEKKEDEKTAK